MQSILKSSDRTELILRFATLPTNRARHRTSLIKQSGAELKCCAPNEPLPPLAPRPRSSVGR